MKTILIFFVSLSLVSFCDCECCHKSAINQKIKYDNIIEKERRIINEQLKREIEHQNRILKSVNKKKDKVAVIINRLEYSIRKEPISYHILKSVNK